MQSALHSHCQRLIVNIFTRAAFVTIAGATGQTAHAYWQSQAKCHGQAGHGPFHTYSSTFHGFVLLLFLFPLKPTDLLPCPFFGATRRNRARPQLWLARTIPPL